MNPKMHAASDAYLRTASGGIDYNCTLGATLDLYEDGPPDLLVATKHTTTSGYLLQTARATAREEHCYRARMIATGQGYLGSTINGGWLSPIACTEPPPDERPVLLDLADNGFHLSGPEPPVSFDIDADGSPDAISWTRGGTDDSFLCSDLNGNGLVDNGAELFGTATLLPQGNPANSGYDAIAALDTPAQGGNGDGYLDSAEPQFAALCTWTDSTRDGVSQASEVAHLSDSNIVALGYRYRTTRLRDEFGNWFRYLAPIRRSTGGHTVQRYSVDVFSVRAEQ